MSASNSESNNHKITPGGYPVDTYDAVDSDFKSGYHEETSQNNYMLNQVSYADTRDTKGAVEQEDYGADGYLNHLHINYWGGDDG